MSWLFSQALVEEYSQGKLLDGEPSAQWNVMPTPQGFWRNDKMMEHSRLSQFGQTLQLLTEAAGEALLTLFLEGFRAKTSLALVQGQDSTESAADYGEKWRGSYAKYDRDLSLWKTHQYSLLGGLDEFSETWPRWGSMLNGECWERQMWERHICENESGLLPTPCASDYRGGRTTEAGERVQRGPKNNFRDFCRQIVGWKYPNPEASENLMGWPIGWTDLRPLGTGKFRNVLPRLGIGF